MGFNFSFFGEPSHRQFNYKPRYYDVEQEERRKFFGDHAAPNSAQDGDTNTAQQAQQGGQVPQAQQSKPGRYIYGSFRDGNYQRDKVETTKAKKLIGIVALILIFVVLYYFAKFYMLILS